MVKGSGGTRWPVAPLPPSLKAPKQASGVTPPVCLRVAVAAGHPDGTHLDTFTGTVGAAGDPQHAPGPRLHLCPILGVKPESSQVPFPRTGGAWQEGPESPGVHVARLRPRSPFSALGHQALKAKRKNSSAQRGCLNSGSFACKRPLVPQGWCPGELRAPAGPGPEASCACACPPQGREG